MILVTTTRTHFVNSYGYAKCFDEPMLNSPEIKQFFSFCFANAIFFFIFSKPAGDPIAFIREQDWSKHDCL